MPKFITRPGAQDTTYAGPYTARGVSMRIYTLDAGYAALAATVQRYLGPVTPPGSLFLPLGDRVLACFAAMREVVGVDPTLGSMREIDVAFFLPVVRFSGIVPQEVVFFAPYLFVDIPQALATGREVHGYRKEFGTSFSTVDTYADAWQPSAADLTHVEAWAVPAPSARLKRMRLVDVRPPGAPGSPIAWTTPSGTVQDIATELIGDISHFLRVAGVIFGKGAGLVEAVLRPVLGGLFHNLVDGAKFTVPIAFLRQLRDPRNSIDADVQQLLIADVTVPLASLAGHKLPAGWGVEFHDTTSHPFSAELGVPQGAPVPSGLTMEVACDFTLGHAT
jgi:hypothetical protein